MPIPYQAIGRSIRRASEADRDRAAMELASYIIGLLRFDHGAIDCEGLLKRANKVRVSQGNGEIVFVNDTAEKIRAVAVPSISDAAYEATQEQLIHTMGEP